MSSTNCIGDIGTVLTNGPNAATTAKASAAAGPIMDYIGNCKLVQLKLQECVELIGLSGVPKGIVTDTDAGTDSTNLALLTAVSNLLTGGGAPSSTAVTAMKSVLTNGPAAATTAKASAAAGPIMDYIGNCNLVLLKLQEVYELLSPSPYVPKTLIYVTDSTDSVNLALLNGIAAVLV